MMPRLLAFLVVGLIVFGAARAAASEVEVSTPVVSAVRIEGASALPAKVLLKNQPLHKGRPLTPTGAAAALASVASAARARGYLEVQVSSRAETRDGRADVIFTVREGPLYRFGETRVEGLVRYPEAAVRRELSYRPGRPYETPELFAGQSRLYALGVFEDLRVETSTTPAHAVDVRIVVSEKPMKWIKGGVGYGSEDRQRARLSLSHLNLFRRAYTAELSGTVSALGQDYQAEFVNRHLFGGPLEHRALASWRREDREGYDLERLQGRLQLGRSFRGGIRASTHFRFERDVASGVVPALASAAPAKSRIRALEILLNRDVLDDPFFPTRGVRSGLLLERSGGILGGDVHYNKASVETAVYRPIWKALIGAVSAAGGVVREFSPSQEVPVYERFFLGGATTVRGYKERGLGPRDAGGNPLGGNVFFRGNAELRFPIVWRLSGAAFVDGGQLGRDARSAQPARWKYGAGAGIRFRTPVGPFRLDYGYKVNRDRGDPDLWRIHLSLGEAF